MRKNKKMQMNSFKFKVSSFKLGNLNGEALNEGKPET